MTLKARVPNLFLFAFSQQKAAAEEEAVFFSSPFKLRIQHHTPYPIQSLPRLSHKRT